MQILKALANICCDWLRKTRVAFPPSKHTCHVLSTLSTTAYQLVFGLQQEAKGLGSTCRRDWCRTNTHLETLLTEKSLLPKRTRRIAQEGEQAHRWSDCPKSPAEPGDQLPNVALMCHAQLLPTTSTNELPVLYTHTHTPFSYFLSRETWQETVLMVSLLLDLRVLSIW